MIHSLNIARQRKERKEQSERDEDTPEKGRKSALNTPKIVFTPKKAMRDAANSVELSIDRSNVTAAGTSGDGEDGDNPVG